MEQTKAKKRGRQMGGRVVSKQPKRKQLEGVFPYYVWESAEQMRLMEQMCRAELTEWRRIWREHQSLKPGDPLSAKKSNRVNHRAVLAEAYIRLRDAHVRSGGVVPQ